MVARCRPFVGSAYSQTLIKTEMSLGLRRQIGFEGLRRMSRSLLKFSKRSLRVEFMQPQRIEQAPRRQAAVGLLCKSRAESRPMPFCLQSTEARDI